jgi:hypothetical protein
MLETSKGRRKLLVGIATVGLTLGASGAYAFWIGTGSAGGTAVVGSQSADLIEIRQLNQPYGLIPGGPAKPLKMQVTNPDPDPDSGVYVFSIHITVNPDWSVDADGEGPLPPCTAADFDFTDPVLDTNVLGGTPEVINGEIWMVNRTATPEAPEESDPSNQESCKGATVELILTPVYEDPTP